MFKIVFASNNKGKHNELVDAFRNEGIDLVFLGNLTLEENSTSLANNALMKAQQAAAQTGLPAMGDDSGLFIDDLDYFPGVYSRRWLAESTDDGARSDAILELMKNSHFNRRAELISRFAVVDKDGRPISLPVTKNNFYISYERRGKNGFGYDDILIPIEIVTNGKTFEENLKNRTIGEMTLEEKNEKNNRGRIAVEVAYDLEKGGFIWRE